MGSFGELHFSLFLYFGPAIDMHLKLFFSLLALAATAAADT
jgi:hypothetical protein